MAKVYCVMEKEYMEVFREVERMSYMTPEQFAKAKAAGRNVRKIKEVQV